jgi:succinate dehydrogenase / fumarate reductase, cytochrome b subunit
MMAQADRGVERPLSPHLQIYRPLINMVMSVLHRVTGIVLYFGMLLLTAWLVAAAYGPEAYGYVAAVVDSIFGRLVLLGFAWAIIHHALGGVRHFIWDTGRGFSIRAVDALCWLTIILSVVLTLALWWAVGDFAEVIRSILQ